MNLDCLACFLFECSILFNQVEYLDSRIFNTFMLSILTFRYLWDEMHARVPFPDSIVGLMPLATRWSCLFAHSIKKKRPWPLLALPWPYCRMQFNYLMFAKLIKVVHTKEFNRYQRITFYFLSEAQSLKNDYLHVFVSVS